MSENVRPVVGGTWKGAMITAVHLHADPLCPDETEGVVLGWIAHRDEYMVGIVNMGGEIVNERYPATLERALFVYSQLVASKLHGFANVPVPALTFDYSPEEV